MVNKNVLEICVMLGVSMSAFVLYLYGFQVSLKSQFSYTPWNLMIYEDIVYQAQIIMV